MAVPLARFCLLGMAGLVAACSSDPAAPPASAQGGEHIACALGGAEQFADVCAVERTEQGGAPYLVVRHPDGAFRRFAIVRDGRGVAVADGAQEAQIALDGDRLEVAIGRDRYRFPAVKMNHEPAS